jgi:hypothetical protein
MRNHERENIGKESLSRNPGEGIFEGGIMEEETLRRKH